MMDEDYAYERQRQRRLDHISEEVDALQILRAEVIHMSYHEDTCFQHGFLCTAINIAYCHLSGKQHNFLRQKVRSILNSSSVINIEMEDNLPHKYLGNESMFAAMAHAYRLGIIDQWIANQKEKENE